MPASSYSSFVWLKTTSESNPDENEIHYSDIILKDKLIVHRRFYRSYSLGMS